MTQGSDEEEKALVVRRLNALAAMLSRGAPLPDDFPTAKPDRPVAVVPVRPEPIPEPVSRRMEKPVEVQPDGTVKVRGYKRKSRGWLSDWEERINDPR